MRPGPAQYVTGRRAPRRPFLRTAQLNAVGWAALVVVCLLAGVLTAFLLGRTVWLPLRAAVGPVAVLVALIVADRRKWSRMEAGLSFPDHPAELRRVADRLVEQGVPVRMTGDDRHPSLRYRNGDTKRVHDALRALGIRID